MIHILTNSALFLYTTGPLSLPILQDPLLRKHVQWTSTSNSSSPHHFIFDLGL